MASPGSPHPTGLGVASNVGGLLCYVPCCIGLIFSIVVVIVEKQSKFLRFHAFQSLLLNGAGFALGIALQVANVALALLHVGILSLLVGLVGMLLGVGLLIASIFMMIKAFGNEETELPVIGPMARGWA